MRATLAFSSSVSWRYVLRNGSGMVSPLVERIDGKSDRDRPHPDRRRAEREGLARPGQEQRLADGAGDGGRGVARPRIADAFPPCRVGESFELEMFFGLDERLQRREFERGERPVPGLVDR